MQIVLFVDCKSQMGITLSISIQWSLGIEVVGDAVKQGGGYPDIAKHAHPLAEERRNGQRYFSYRTG
jgi:hypothetical protein